jgi:hypothetical protein
MQRSTPWLILVIVVLAILVILSKRSSVEGQDAAVQAPAGPEAAVAIVGGATLNHFKCYGTKGSEVGKTVLLRDQFAAEKVRVLGPEQFCNPVAKRHGRFIWPIVDLMPI